jgi:hypothetical protein
MAIRGRSDEFATTVLQHDGQYRIDSTRSTRAWINIRSTSSSDT